MNSAGVNVGVEVLFELLLSVPGGVHLEVGCWVTG